MKKTLCLAPASLLLFAFCPFWGFFAHQHINRLAVFTLPPEMIGFYKKNISAIISISVSPDKRRYAVESEAPRHYVDLDHYGDSALQRLPRKWQEAVRHLGEDTLEAYGTLPWHLTRMYYSLREAFQVRDPAAIIRLSAEFGHYVADAHVPLHTTENYNGQLTGQEGIHGFWESRLPEIYFDGYDFFVGRAAYIEDPEGVFWRIIQQSHSMVHEVLAVERRLSKEFGERKYSFETRGNATVRVYASEYASAYHSALKGMVEKQMRASVKMVGDIWYTAWIDAGQPDLHKLIDHKPTAEQLLRNRQEVEALKAATKRIRDHE